MQTFQKEFALLYQAIDSFCVLKRSVHVRPPWRDQVHVIWWHEKAEVIPSPRAKKLGASLRCYRNILEGRGDGLKRLNLGRSIDHSCKCSQHFWVGIAAISFCIGLAVPQTDGNNIQAAGI